MPHAIEGPRAPEHEALVAEYKPQGPTEEHLVEELASVIWRKRRLQMAERAIHYRAVKGACRAFRETAEAALVHVGKPGKTETVADAIRATHRGGDSGRLRRP
jgi:hypothetical protein